MDSSTNGHYCEFPRVSAYERVDCSQMLEERYTSMYIFLSLTLEVSRCEASKPAPVSRKLRYKARLLLQTWFLAEVSELINFVVVVLSSNQHGSLYSTRAKLKLFSASEKK